MTNVTKFPRGGAKPPAAPRMPALKKPRLVDALHDDAARAIIARDIVDRGRELTSRQCKVDYWLARTAHFRAIAKREGASRERIDAAISLLCASVRAENERRHALAIAAAKFDIPYLGFEVAAQAEAQIVRFPGEPDLDEAEAILPQGFR